MQKRAWKKKNRDLIFENDKILKSGKIGHLENTNLNGKCSGKISKGKIVKSRLLTVKLGINFKVEAKVKIREAVSEENGRH